MILGKTIPPFKGFGKYESLIQLNSTVILSNLRGHHAKGATSDRQSESLQLHSSIAYP